MEKKTCLGAALSKLDYRMRTEKEIYDFLKDEEFESDEISQTISYLKEFHYIDDEKYITEFYNASKNKNWADRRIIFELEKKGIDSQDAKSVIEEYKTSGDYSGIIDDDQRALKIGIGMANDHISMGKPMDDKFFAKVGRKLQGLGYSQRTCYYVIDRLRKGGKAASIEKEAAEKERKKKEEEYLYYSSILNK